MTTSTGRSPMWRGSYCQTAPQAKIYDFKALNHRARATSLISSRSCTPFAVSSLRPRRGHSRSELEPRWPGARGQLWSGIFTPVSRLQSADERRRRRPRRCRQRWLEGAGRGHSPQSSATFSLIARHEHLRPRQRGGGDHRRFASQHQAAHLWHLPFSRRRGPLAVVLSTLTLWHQGST